MAGIVAFEPPERLPNKVFSRVVHAWNKATPSEKRQRLGECRTVGHAWRRAPFRSNGRSVNVCTRCLKYSAYDGAIDA